MSVCKEVRFYQLSRQPLELALPRLLEKLLERGLRAVVRLPDPLTLETLDKALWTYDPASFLPHGTEEGGLADQQPIFLTTGTERPNAADTLVLINGAAAPEPLTDYGLCLYMFDGDDERILARARDDWRRYRDLGETVSYWAQKEQGGWEQKA